MVTCKYCNSDFVIKRGMRNGSQLFSCRECDRYFIDNSNFEKHRYKKEMLGLALDLFYEGISLRRIKIHLKSYYNVEVSHVGIYKWVMKYSDNINNYLTQLIRNKYKTRFDTWHVDETVLNCYGQQRWFWDVVDAETRFWIDGIYTRFKHKETAVRLFERCKMNFGDPRIIITDGFGGYVNAARNVLKETKHVRNVGIQAKINNNIIESFHRTLKHRYFLMRGFRSMRSAIIILKGMRIHYNFIKVHSSIGNNTPAEQAGIHLGLDNRWSSLIEELQDTKVNKL